MLIALVGKSNCGKSTMFSAATLADAEISNRIFTTIEPNKGVSFARTKCVCSELGVECNPQDGFCSDGTRYVPAKLIDVAGLVPGAHEGRGLGNKFLADIMEADALIHVVDASGGTDRDGNPVEPGTHDPAEDVAMLPREVSWWMLDVLKRNWRAARSGFVAHAAKQFSGLKVDEKTVKSLADGLSGDSGDEELLEFVSELRERSKPTVVAANKIDVPGAKEVGVPTSAESELALRRAAESDTITYNPGDADFEITGEPSEKQRKALEFIRAQVLEKYGSTGVQKCINKAVFDELDMIVVYPVENENKYTDSSENVLPNALLMKKGSTPKNLAYRVHADIGDAFVAAVDARTGKRLAADYELRDGDVVSIKTR